MSGYVGGDNADITVGSFKKEDKKPEEQKVEKRGGKIIKKIFFILLGIILLAIFFYAFLIFIGISDNKDVTIPLWLTSLDVLVGLAGLVVGIISLVHGITIDTKN